MLAKRRTQPPIMEMPAICGQEKGSFQRICANTVKPAQLAATEGKVTEIRAKIK
jgi:hypothetical protein